MTVLLSLLLAAVPLCPQDGPGTSVEQMRESLRARAASARSAAAAAWKEHGTLYLRKPEAENAAPLLEHSPHIQEPALSALGEQLATTPLTEAAAKNVDALLDLLDQTLNASGADALASLVPKLGTGERAIRALDLAATHGSRQALLTARKWLAEGDAKQKGGALGVLLGFGPLQRSQSVIQHADPKTIDATLMSQAFHRLAARGVPNGFVVPETLLTPDQPRKLADGLIALLAVAPQEGAEDLLLGIALTRSYGSPLRASTLPLIEHGIHEFRWRASQPRLQKFLKEYDKDAIASEIAWSLHRLEDRTGTRFLLADPLARVKAKPREGRSRFEIGELYVELGQHSAGFREFRTGFSLVEGTPQERRIEPATWVMAARSAAGSRRFKEAAAWLRRARLTPEELEPYRDLPEFTPVLDRKPFDELFGTDA